MSKILKLMGLLGFILFASLFSATFISSDRLEESAKGFVKNQIEKEIRQKQQILKDSKVTRSALDIAKKLGFEKENIQSKLDNKLPEIIATVVASMCGYDCEKKKAITKSVTTGYLDKIKSIQIAENTLSDIVKDKYLEIVSNLKLDLRIFLGSNLVMFIILLVIAFAKPQAAVHLYLPGILLLLATILASSFYIFGQDWFYTILYNDYMGFGYLLYIALIFGFLLDISFNKCRGSSGVINGVANVFGSAFSVLSC